MTTLKKHLKLSEKSTIKFYNNNDIQLIFILKWYHFFITIVSYMFQLKQ